MTTTSSFPSFPSANINSTMVLLMELSRPISLAGELFNLVQKALVQHFGEEFQTSLRAIILHNPRQAVVFLLNNSILSQQKITEQPLSLGEGGGSITVTFSFTNLTTEYIEIDIPLGPQSIFIQDLQALATTPSDSLGYHQCLMFYRTSSVLLKFQSPNFAINIEKNLQYLPHAASTHLVTLTDHCCLDCWWLSKIPLNEVITRLKRTGETLSGVIQGIFALMVEQPCILDISLPLKNSLTSKDDPDLIIVCCTNNDANIIARNSLGLQVGTIGKIFFTLQEFLENEQDSGSDEIASHENSITSEDLNTSFNGTDPKQYHHQKEVEDDDSNEDEVENEDEDDNDNEEDVYEEEIKGKDHHHFPSLIECFLFWDVDTCPLPIELSQQKMLSNIVTILKSRGMILSRSGHFAFLTNNTPQHNEFVWREHGQIQLVVIPSTQRIATVGAMKKELEVFLHKHIDNQTTAAATPVSKVAICCITNDGEFQLILKNIIENEKFTQLLLFCGRQSTLLDLAPQPQSMFWENVLYLEDYYGDEQSKNSSILPLKKNDQRPMPVENKKHHTILQDELQKQSMTHDSNANANANAASYFRPVRVSRFSMAAHLNNIIKWNEDEINGGRLLSSIESPPVEEILKNKDADSQIEVSIDRDKRKQKIIVSGKSEEVVKAKVILVENLLSKLSSNRKVLRLHGWKSPHREAMMGSNPLNSISQSFRTTVVFHVTDGHIVAEMMSTSEVGILQMSEYLKSLQPVDATWIFDTKFLIPEPRIRFWNSIRNKYAVMFEKNVLKGVLEVHAWGFGSLLHDAHTELQSAALGKPIPPSTTVSHLKLEKPTRVSQLPPPPPPPTPTHTPPTDTFQIAEYQFQNLEAAHFYQCYEEMFQSYLHTSYHVLVTAAPTSVSLGAAILDIRGSPDDISSAKIYFDQIQQNLNCKEVTLHILNKEMYQEITDLQDAFVRSSVHEAICRSSMNEDPLRCPGLIAIRVKTFLSQQGFRKYTFPTDMTLCISESYYNTRMQGNRGDQSPKMARIIEQLRSFTQLGVGIKSEWATNFSQRGLIVEPPGFSHDRHETGGDFVSEDIRQWLSSMSSSGSPVSRHLSNPDPSHTSNHEQFQSTRKTFSDALKSSSSSNSLYTTPATSASRDHLELYRRTVHWPHSSFRYMFLGERMKEFIHETVQIIRSRYGEYITITCPYRDKKDASVCILLEGHEGVDDAVNLFNHMLARVLAELRCMTLILSGTQFTCLTAQDLVKVKAIQGSAGVHVMLSPTPSDLQTSIETIDLRHLENTSIKDDEVVRVRLPGFNKRQVDISIMSAPAEAPGWTWGVNTLFAVLEKDDDCGLTRQEIDKLNHGEVLVTSDFESGKTILRARISTSALSNTTMARALSGMPTEKLLSNVISRGLAQADILGLNGIAIIAPDTLTELASLGGDRICSVTVASVVDHIRTHQLFHLDRVVCLEVVRPRTTANPSVMAETLCKLIKDSNEAKVPVCNDSLCSAIIGKKKFESLNDTTHTIVIKGIHECLVVALHEIKEIITR